ncbi:ABC transporter permease [Anopheles sinensis]|uniref:ABC transporter permease n=1 Tax=Anopheles sinensis TaxID=74873 RepID=A0A084VZH1_ANOSI|nr:ABC transporter permease [Anopheles sinensis]
MTDSRMSLFRSCKMQWDGAGRCEITPRVCGAIAFGLEPSFRAEVFLFGATAVAKGETESETQTETNNIRMEEGGCGA